MPGRPTSRPMTSSPGKSPACISCGSLSPNPRSKFLARQEDIYSVCRFTKPSSASGLCSISPDLRRSGSECRQAAGRPAFRVLAPILAVYASAEVAFTVQSWNAPQTIGPFPALYAYLFAALKIVYTLIFGTLVGHIGMPERDRRGGVLHWILIFLYLRNSHHGEEHHAA